MVASSNWRGDRSRILAALAAATLIAAPAAAQGKKRFDIPAQPVASALNAFSAQSGYRVLYPDGPATHRNARPITGDITPSAALRSLLEDSGLRVLSKTDKVITLSLLQATAIEPRPVARSAAVPPPVVEVAQAEPVTATEGLEDIVVTATRREERLQNVPVAVTALTGATLAERQIVSIDGIQRSTPNLSIAPFGDRTTSIIALRGQVASDNISSVDPAVGVYLDGVYIARSTGGNLNLIDMERVEVLRGPQGTLFGRNTIGGAVSLSTNKPTDRVEGSIAGSYGNYNAWTLTGVINYPVSEGIAVRLVGQHSERDGFAKSTITGVDLNAENLDYLRGSVSFDMAPDWNLLLTGDYTSFRNHGQWITLLKALPLANTVAGVVSGGTLTASQFVDPFTKHVASTMLGPFTSKSWGGAATLNGKIGDVNIRSITAFRNMERFLRDFDQDGTPFELLHLNNHIKQHQISQELQIFGKFFNDKVDWIVGGYYFDEKAHDEVVQHFIFPVNPNYSITDGKVQNKSVSVYSQITLALTDELSVVGGIRYTRDTRGVTLFNRTAGASPELTIRCNTVGATLPTCAISPPKRSFSYVPFTVGVNFKPTRDVLFYGKLSRGYRSGGFNLRATAAEALAPFGPERLDSYEAGAKIDIGRAIRFNVAIFQSRFSNIQITTSQATGSGVTTLVIANAGSARINGAELELTAALGRIRLGGSLGVTDPKYTKLDPSAVGVSRASRFAFTPEVNYSMNASYTLPTRFGSLEFQADYSWRGSIAYALTPPADAANIAASYGLLNAIMTAKLTSGFQMSVWGRNLADKKYINRVTDLTPAGFLNAYPGDPRTYGVSAKFSF